MDKKKAQNIAKAIKAAISGVESEFGVSIAIDGGRFDENTFSPRVNISDVESGGTVVTKELADLRILYPKLEGKEIALNGQNFKVIGYRRSAPKYPFIVESLSGDNRRLVCSMETVMPRDLTKQGKTMNEFLN